jgi:1-acyl-sn-glycerol-3-phosphate acyltransferase
MTIVLFIPIVLAALFSSTGNLAFTISKLWAWVMLKVTNVRVEITGQDKIDPEKSYIIISNHQSFFDIVSLVTTLNIQFRWIIKKEIFKVPLFGYALYASRNIFIDRSNRNRAIQSMKEGLDRLPPGLKKVVLFWPWKIIFQFYLLP